MRTTPTTLSHFMAIFIISAFFTYCTEKPQSLSENALAIGIDGSSTVYPITNHIVDSYRKSSNDLNIAINVSGTGGGFAKFSQGSIDINNASRPISTEERLACEANGIAYIEFKVAYDGIAIVANKSNTWVDNLTVQELQLIWGEGQPLKWSEVRPTWPNDIISLFAPGESSGTYDYFKEAMLDSNEKFRDNIKMSENDNLLVQGISNDPNALGFFGLSYFENNKSKLKLIGVDNGNGPILPSQTTIGQGTYKPLSRPIYIYVKKSLLELPTGKKFVGYYLANAANAALAVGYVPLSDSELESEKKKL